MNRVGIIPFLVGAVLGTLALTFVTLSQSVGRAVEGFSFRYSR